MKKFTLSTLLFFAICIAQAQSNAKITFPTVKYNYGTIKEDDGVAYHEFEFNNTGTTPLIIQRVSSSCGCTTPEWPKEPIAPNKSGKIKVGYNPKQVNGPFSKTISVYSNAEPNVIVLQISGMVEPHVKTVEEIYRISIGDLRFERNHFALGRLFLNKVVTDTLKFINKGTAPVKVTTNVDQMKFLLVNITPKEVKPDEFGTIVLTYDPKKREDWGFVVDRFVLNVNDQPFANTPITITGSIEDDYSNMTPEQLESAPQVNFNTTVYNFESKVEGEPVEFEFIVRNTGKSDLIIRKVKASCGCTTVEPAKKVLKAGESTTILARFRTNGYSGQQSKSITVITNDPKKSTTVLRLSGNILKKPQQ
ncbi:MAG: DUF1573 domain-containing protein [Bacteroidales bacterium]